MASGRKAVSDKSGRAFLEELAETKDARSLEILWRADEPELQVKLVPLMAASRDELLGHLLVGAFLQHGANPQVVGAIGRHGITAALPYDDTQRLIDHIKSAPPQSVRSTQPQSPTAKPAAVWTLAQRHANATQFARDVVVADVSFAGNDEDVYKKACARAGHDKSARDQIAQRLGVDLSGRNDARTWLRAARFLDRIPLDRTSTQISRLLTLVCENAGVGAETPGVTLRARLAANPDVLLATFEGPALRASEASSGLIDVITDIQDDDTRGRLSAAALLRQPNIGPRLDQGARRWSDAEWTIRLAGLIDYAVTSSPATVATLLDRAPNSMAALVMKAASRHANARTPQLRETVIRKTTAALEEFAGADEQARRLAWPSSADDPLAELAKTVLANKSTEHRGLLVAHAVAQGFVPVDVVPALLEASDFTFALLTPPLDDDALSALAAVLWDAAPDHMTNRLRPQQQKAFRLPIARALASRDNSAAFAGAAKVYAELDSAARDELVDLLEAHGQWSEEEVFAAIADDTTASNAKRRGRVLAVVGRVAPPGLAAPPYLRAAISSGNQNVVGPAFEAVATIAPVDAEIVKELRTIASQPGPNRARAQAALDRLTSTYLDGLVAVEGVRDAEVSLLAALGATAIPTAIDRVLDYLGPEAVDDHPEVRRAAAKALEESMTAAAEASPLQLERLGALIDGDDREADPAARSSLQAAFARASLGENAALAVVYELAEIPLPKNVEELKLDNEKAGLLRQASLYKAAESLGRVGWPMAISHLDMMAMFLARAAYALVGRNEGTKEALRRGDQDDPKWGALIDQLQGALDGARGPLKTLHDLRSTETEITHPGSAPNEATVTTAKTCFRNAARILLRQLRPT